MADLTPELLAQLEMDVAADNVDDRVEFLAHHCEELARVINALPALVAAAKERDQLRAELERQSGQLVNMEHWLARVQEARSEDLDYGQMMREEAERLGSPIAIPFSDRRSRHREEVEWLRAEVERLRQLGIEAVVLLDFVQEGQPWALNAIDGELPRIRSEIERKS